MQRKESEKELVEVPEFMHHEGSLSDYNVEHINREHSDAEDEFEESELLLAEDIGYDEEEEIGDYEDI